MAVFLLSFTTQPLCGQAAFFRDVVLRASATQEDCVRALGILSQGRNAARVPLGQVVDDLKQKGWMPRRWNVEPERSASKGFASYLFVKALSIKGGAGARIFGMNKRRAYRELVDLRMIPSGGEYSSLTGAELITLLDRASQYRRAR